MMTNVFLLVCMFALPHYKAKLVDNSLGPIPVFIFCNIIMLTKFFFSAVENKRGFEGLMLGEHCVCELENHIIFNQEQRLPCHAGKGHA